MSRRKKDPLRSLTENERQLLQQVSRSHTAPSVAVVRAQLLLLVAAGSPYQDAARAVGRRSLTSVSLLAARFHAEGVAALTPRHAVPNLSMATRNANAFSPSSPALLTPNTMGA